MPLYPGKAIRHPQVALARQESDRTSNGEMMEPDFISLIRNIQESRSVNFWGHKKTRLRRRVSRRMAEIGSKSFAAYHARLEADLSKFNELFGTPRSRSLPSSAIPKHCNFRKLSQEWRRGLGDSLAFAPLRQQNLRHTPD